MAKFNLMKIDEFTNELIQPLEDIFEQLNNDVTGVIVKRLNKIGKLSGTDINKFANDARLADLKEIEIMIAKAQKNSIKELDKIIMESAKYNDLLYDELYKTQQVENLGIVSNRQLQAITSYAKKNMENEVLNLTKTAAFVTNGKMSSIRKTYIESVNLGVMQVNTGLLDYNTAIRGQVLKLANSGLRTVDFESGYSRRLDSQVRMNVLDGVRQMNQEYREQQGREFGADGVEISVHYMCASDHIPVQGRQYTYEEFERLQSVLKRPIGTMNCRHSTFPIIKGISEPVYSENELKKANTESQRKVKYTDQRGQEKTTTKYEASQIQRNIETDLRRLKEKRFQFENSEDDIMIKKYNKLIREKSLYYKKMSSEVGLPTSPKRSQIVS